MFRDNTLATAEGMRQAWLEVGGVLVSQKWTYQQFVDLCEQLKPNSAVRITVSDISQLKRGKNISQSKVAVMVECCEHVNKRGANFFMDSVTMKLGQEFYEDLYLDLLEMEELLGKDGAKNLTKVRELLMQVHPKLENLSKKIGKHLTL